VIDDVESCMMGELDFCDEKSISQIFKLLFDFFKRELNCPEPIQVRKTYFSLGNYTLKLLSRFYVAPPFFVGNKTTELHQLRKHSKSCSNIPINGHFYSFIFV